MPSRPIDLFEHMFDHGVWPHTDTLDYHRASSALRMERMHDGVPRMDLATHPALAGLVQLRAGGS